MPPKPDPVTRADAKQRVADLKKTRDQAHEAAEKTKVTADEDMWKSIAAELDTKKLLQRDVAEMLGFSRDHVLRRTKKYRNPE